MSHSPSPLHVELTDSDPEEPPTRPSTALGFTTSHDTYSSCPSHDTHPPVSWSRTHQLPILDPSTVSSVSPDNHLISGDGSVSLPLIPTCSPDHLDTISGSAQSALNLAHSHEICGDTLSSSDTDDSDSQLFESDCSSCDSSDDEINICPISPSPPMTPPPSPPRSVSRLSFPFCKPKLRPRVSVPPPLRRAPPPPPPPPVNKFSCLPSPLSPNRTFTRPDCPPSAPTRHNYEEHGYSRHAFLHLKQFWLAREDEWDVKVPRSQVSTSGPGQSPDLLRPIKLNSSFRLSKKARLRIDPDDTFPPPTIHPRRGDISALRDPWCADIDRCFASLPVWTISKTLWMYDLHLEIERRAKTDDSGADDDTESEADTSMSVSCSDDSDATLVDLESDIDQKRLSSRIPSWDSIPGDEKLLISYSPHGESSAYPFTVSLSKTYPLSKLHSESLLYHDISYYPRSPIPHWITNWYARWELIGDLTRRDQEHKLAENDFHQVQTTTSTSNERGSRFFIVK